MKKQSIADVIVYAIQIVFAGVILYKTGEQDLVGVFVIAQAIIVSALPYGLQRFASITTPPFVRVSIAVFMFASLMLGETAHFYTTFSWWDLVLHALAGAGLTVIGFIVMTLFFIKNNLQKQALIISLLSFSFALFLAVSWEIYEFFVDGIFTPNPPMQPSNEDTMSDIIVSIVGSGVIGVFGYTYLLRAKKSLVGKIIEEGVLENGHL